MGLQNLDECDGCADRAELAQQLRELLRQRLTFLGGRSLFSRRLLRWLLGRRFRIEGRPVIVADAWPSALRIAFDIDPFAGIGPAFRIARLTRFEAGFLNERLQARQGEQHPFASEMAGRHVVA